MAGENLKNEWGGIFAFKEYIAFYGIKIPWPRYHFLDGKTTDNNFLFWAESQKYLLIAVSALVGATLIITSKKK
jgi:hypothetical protein